MGSIPPIDRVAGTTFESLGQSPAKPATATCSRAVGEYVQIFESCDRMSALIYSAASFKPIQGENSSDRQPCYLPPQQLE